MRIKNNWLTIATLSTLERVHFLADPVYLLQGRYVIVYWSVGLLAGNVM